LVSRHSYRLSHSTSLKVTFEGHIKKKIEAQLSIFSFKSGSLGIVSKTILHNLRSVIVLDVV
jgi:hypothetical protein